MQKGYNKGLKEGTKRYDFGSIRKTLHKIVELTFEESITGSLERIRNTVNILVNDYTDDLNILTGKLELTVKDYTTFVHSVNVVVLALGYASYVSLVPSQNQNLAVAALLLDIGKARISICFLTASRKLTEEEVMEVQKHTFMRSQSKS